MGVEPLELFSTSAGAVLTLLFMMGGGALAGLRGCLPAESIKAMNKLNLQLLLPCMLFTRVSQSASIEAWTVCWVLPASALVQLGLGFGLSSLFARAANLPSGVSRVFRMSGTFGNSQAFPMVVLQLVAKELLPDDPAASDRAMSYVAYYLVCWSVVCWSAGWAFISAPLPDGAAGGAESARRRAAAEGGEGAAPTPPLVPAGELEPAAEVELAWGGVAAPASLGCGGPEGEEGAADAAADLIAHPPQGARRLRGGCSAVLRACARGLRACLRSQALSPPVVAVLCGLGVGMSPLKGLFVGPGAPLQLLHRAALLLGDSVVPLSTLLSGASLVAANAGGGAGKREGAPARASVARRAADVLCRAELLGVVLVRLLALPACSWLLFLCARRFLGLFPTGPGGGGVGPVDPLIGFVVLLEGAMPTANNVVRAPRTVRQARLCGCRVAAAARALAHLALAAAMRPCLSPGDDDDDRARRRPEPARGHADGRAGRAAAAHASRLDDALPRDRVHLRPVLHGDERRW